MALGGNAIKRESERGTAEEQLNNCYLTSRHLVKLIKKLGKDDRLIITHGNGPQAGNLLVQQDSGRSSVPSQPMDVVGAMTQGQIGYMLQQTLENCMCDEGIDRPVLVVINQVLVDRDDPEFKGDAASKPVGDFLTKTQAEEAKKEHPGYIFREVKSNGGHKWRRVVPSPLPVRNVEGSLIKRLVDEGIVVIASGGGGIPVVLEGPHLRGVEAVVDKDLAAEVLAEVVGATTMIILTDVPKVMLDYGKSSQKEIDTMTVSEARAHLAEGQFPPGSMGPKVRACVRFLEAGGDRALITSLEGAAESIDGGTGTSIVPD